MPVVIGRRTPSAHATSPPLSPWTTTVPVMTMNTRARRSFPPAKSFPASTCANKEATAAATTPRGDSHATNARSRIVSSDPAVQTATLIGRTTNISAPTVATAKGTRTVRGIFHTSAVDESPPKMTSPWLITI